MGTRALIGYLDTTQTPAVLTSTTNQYDGYYENRFKNKDGEEEIIPGLGSNLDKFYNSDSKAEEIANMGYISYVDSDTGEGVNNSNSTSQPQKIKLSDDFNEAMMEIAVEIDRGGRQYGYIWDNENEEWITIENNGIGRMAEDLEMNLAHLKDKFAMIPERPEQTMENKDKIKEGTWSVLPNRIPEFIKAMENLKEEFHSVVGDDSVYSHLDAAIDAAKDLMSMDSAPEIPGFEGTRVALDDLFEAEYIKHQWQHRAGIIK